MNFDAAHPTLSAALAAHGYATPTPVQAAVLDPEAAGRDLLVSARTGSGKTVAFGLCLAGELLGEATTLGPAATPLALVVAPTRELALQVRRELAWLWGPAGARVVSCVGGMDPRREARTLAEGAHIVVGTPGRLCDHLDRGALRLEGARAVVLDEADEMLDLGFREELERLLDATPTERRTYLFSATLPEGILGLTRRYQRDALRIAASAADEPHADIEHRAVLVAPREREHAIVNLLRIVDPPRALVFAATREGVGHLHASLLERGFSAVALSGELTQAERGRALQMLRDGRARVLVATDVAARGLDLPDLQLVIHGDLPHDAQVLLHRSGRTGRAGKKGTSVMIVASNRARSADRLIREARIEPRWSAPPLAEAVREKDAERLQTEVGAFVGEVGEDERAAAETLAASHSAEALAAALVRLWRQGWPEPEELPETEELHARMGGRGRRDRAERPDRPERGERPERKERPAWPEKPVKVKPGRADRARAAAEVERDPWAEVLKERGPAPGAAAAPGAAPEAAAPRAAMPASPVPGAGPAAPAAAAASAPLLALAAPAPAVSAAPAPHDTSAPTEPEGWPGDADARAALPPVGRTPKRKTAEARPDAGPARAFEGERPARTAEADRGARPAARSDRRGLAAADHDGGRPERPNRVARRQAYRDDGGGEVHSVWFRMNVGRAANADPRWLVPLLCRRGRIEKSDIGAIRILDGETRFEIASDVAGRFAAAVRRPDPREPWVRIVPMERW